jgi:ABC-2 type transport system ATP-binding protein
MSASSTASVCVRDLARRFGDVEALRGISFDVSEGEIFGLLGPNGAGKTTALECILGLRRPDSGAIAVAGIDVLERPERARRVVGAVIQSATLQDKITPRKALGLFASFYGEPAPVEGLIGRFGLQGKADAAFDSLSCGQRQRLFLALAFVNNPRLVVLDEPTAGLDPGSRRELRDVIAGMRAAGRTVLLSTHDVEEAGSLCDRVAILDRGRVVALASPADLIAGSHAATTITVRTARPLLESQLASLPGAAGCARQDGRWVIRTVSVNQTILALAKAAEAAGNELLDLQVVRPSLEDVFLSLTGRALSSDGEGGR